MERLTPWIIAFCAIVLFGVGIGLAFTDRSAVAISSWGMAFLLTVLLLLSKFKHFKGFGFEAELWEQKQAEAAEIVDQMKSLSKLVSWQVSSMAARIGMWDSAFSMSELAQILDDLREHLKAIKISSHEIEESLQPIHQRIAVAYLREARHEVSRAIEMASDALQSDLGSSDAKRSHMAQSMTQTLVDEQERFNLVSQVSIGPLIQFVSHSKIINQKKELIDALAELDCDLKHYMTYKSFRRRERLPNSVY